jgi:hypothetical protein
VVAIRRHRTYGEVDLDRHIRASFGLDGVVLLRYEGEVAVAILEPVRSDGVPTPKSASARRPS